ncbi:hypothetical protein PUN28_012395 [Cardiocondyla obscurior]|uniref:Uncharacterized protein n=1 Tax=Cardiocondyla obscurior TaxID=286306 RepID=A0AAW2FFM0_9HYME
MGRDRYRNGWNASSKLARKFESICNEERKRNERRDKKRRIYYSPEGQAFLRIQENAVTKGFTSIQSKLTLTKFKMIAGQYIKRGNKVEGREQTAKRICAAFDVEY